MRRFFLYGISKSLLLKIILALLIILGVKNVFAAEFNMNNYTSATKTSSKGQYGGTEFVYGGIPGQRWNFGTRYDGRLNDIITYFSYPFEKNTTYRFTYNMATNDFNNNFASSYWWDCDDSDPVAHVFIPTYISYKKVQYSITPSDNTTCIKVQLYAKGNGGGITQIKNWNLSSITLYDPDYQSGSGSGQGTSPAPTPNPNQDIINNQNNNTQDIINNQNENTSDIITSIQETTSHVEETITNTFTNRCSNLFNLRDFYRQVNSAYASSMSDDTISITSNDVWSFLGYEIPVEIGKTYYVSGSAVASNLSTTAMVWVGSSEEVSGNETPDNYLHWENIGNFSTSFVATTDKVYIRLYGTKGTLPNTTIYYQVMLSEHNTSYCSFGSTTSNKLDDVNDGINELNNKLDGLQSVINDERLPEVDIDLEMASDTPISDLLLLPINLLDKVRASLDYSCTPYRLPFGLLGGNEYIDLPCINLYSILGNDVTNIIDYILCFYFAYQIAMLCISIYNNITSLDDGFNALYEPEHAKPIGKHTSEVE